MSDNILQFAPFESFVSPNFWHKLSELKLDYDRLSDSKRSISAFYTNRRASGCVLEVDYTAYNRGAHCPKFSHPAWGTIYNKNTIEEFKELDKVALLTVEGNQLLDDIGSVIDISSNPSLLARFFVLSFADLKNHSYFYWFAFPCPLMPTLKLQNEVIKLSELPQFVNCKEAIRSWPMELQNFFLLYVNGENVEAYSLTRLDPDDVEHYYFCFADPSEYEHPGWVMRNYVAYLIYKNPSFVGKNLKFLGLRYNQHLEMDNSRIWEVKQTEPCDWSEIKFVGWELNLKAKMGPRIANMRDSMDSARLTENSVNLNLKLMKWRLVPNLDLEKISQTKCLIFGAGTLGCGVARNLLSWGFKTITLIDSGKVSFCNPVRQSLYTNADAVAGNRMKATVAAQRLKEINPNVEARGFVVQVPMPGHTVGKSLMEQTNLDLVLIEGQIESHDVIFLLMDSRESRWLPTVLAAAHQKTVINAALGFDSYVVMRHGSAREPEPNIESQEIEGLKCIMGNKLGCYFCNDVTAPGNSLKDRTLDQQCTVTRPGVSNIAASYAVELLVALLHHPLGDLAPAYYGSDKKETVGKIPEGMLGIIPHSIRGLLWNYENILPASQRFNQCVACSKPILDALKTKGGEFLFKTFESAKYLEDLTGISDYKRLNSEIIEFDDAEFEMSDDESKFT